MNSTTNRNKNRLTLQAFFGKIIKPNWKFGFSYSELHNKVPIFYAETLIYDKNLQYSIL